MTYEQKYKTSEERINAFSEWCADRQCNSCVFSRMCGGCDERTVGIDVMAHWLALEAEEDKPEPCYGCGRELTERDIAHRAEHVGEYSGWSIHCTQCGYRSPYATSKYDAISAHNRVARSVRAAMESEVRDERR